MIMRTLHFNNETERKYDGKIFSIRIHVEMNVIKILFSFVCVAQKWKFPSALAIIYWNLKLKWSEKQGEQERESSELHW